MGVQFGDHGIMRQIVGVHHLLDDAMRDLRTWTRPYFLGPGNFHCILHCPQLGEFSHRDKRGDGAAIASQVRDLPGLGFGERISDRTGRFTGSQLVAMCEGHGASVRAANDRTTALAGVAWHPEISVHTRRACRGHVIVGALDGIDHLDQPCIRRLHADGIQL